jgi:WG containing repeat
MRRTAFRFHILVISLLALITPHAQADDPVFNPPEERAVNFTPDRRFNPTDLLPIEVNGLWGYADRRGDVVIQPRYEWADYFYGPIQYDSYRSKWLYACAARYSDNGKMGLLMFKEDKSRKLNNMEGAILKARPVRGRGPDRFYGNYAIHGAWVDHQLRYYFARGFDFGTPGTTYEGALRMIDGLVAVQEGDLCGYINKVGKFSIPMEFAEVRSFYENLAAVRLPPTQNGPWGFIGQNGKFVFLDQTGEIEDLRSYHEGLAAVRIKDKWGFMDKRQRARIKPIYDEVRDFVDGRAAVRRGADWGYIDITGKEVVWGFDGAWDFDIAARTGLEGNKDKKLSTSLGLIRLGDAYGYVNRSGDIVLEARYKSAHPFFRGLARVKCGNSFGYIDTSGQLVWDPRRASKYGIWGVQLPDPVEPKWPGLPQPNGAWGEPFPFEYDVEDHLPSQMPRTHAEWEQLQDQKPEIPDDEQETPIQVEAPKDTRRGHNR